MPLKRDRLLKMHHMKTQRGFSLLELMVGLAVGFVVITAVGVFYSNQSKLHEDHQIKVRMKQDGRAALAIMANEMMIAGFSPDSSVSANITKAGLDDFEFEFIDGTSQRSIRYTHTQDADGEWVIGRGGDVFLASVEALRFLYAFDLDDLGARNGSYGVLEKANGGTVWAYDSNYDGLLDRYYSVNPRTGDLIFRGSLPSTVKLDRIRAAKAWIVLKSDKKKNNDNTATPTLGPVPDLLDSNDPSSSGVFDTDALNSEYEYRLYTATVKLRNMYY